MVSAPPSRRSADRAIALQSLRALVDMLTRSARTIEARTGVTNAQLFVLRQLSLHSALSINELAERAHTRQNTVSSVVGRLVRNGLVIKQRSATDNRRVLLSLTPAARRVVRRAPRPPIAVLLAGLDSLTVRQERALADGLQALVEALKLRTAEAPMLFEGDDAP